MSDRSSFRRTLPAAVGVAALAWAGLVPAQQAWPAKPVRIIVTFTQGGGADTTARLVGEELADTWKQQVVVENQPWNLLRDFQPLGAPSLAYSPRRQVSRMCPNRSRVSICTSFGGMFTLGNLSFHQNGRVASMMARLFV